jgi:hypothetical protein
LLWRVAAGTAVYICLVVLAAPFPHAAGLMLTFPALNGLAFFFAEQPSIGPMARSMLWLPVINGSLCAAFMIVFLSLLGDVNETVLAGSLAVAVVAAWILIAFRPQVIAGIPERRQLPYAIICTFAGVLLVALAHVLLPEVHLGAADKSMFSWQSIDRTILSSKVKIVLFALALAVFLAATTHRRVPDGVRGVLAGLPLVPFGALFSVAALSDLDANEQRRVFENMLRSVALSPAVAIFFIYGFSRYLKSRVIVGSSKLDGLNRFASLIVAWALCGVMIASLSWALIAIL